MSCSTWTDLAHGLADDGGPLRGPAAFKEFHAAYTGAFPDMRIFVENVIEEGDWCAVRFSGTATYTGEGIGLAATQRPVTLTGMSLTRWKNGKIVEGWNNGISPGIMKQLGAG